MTTSAVSTIVSAKVREEPGKVKQREWVRDWDGAITESRIGTGNNPMRRRIFFLLISIVLLSLPSVCVAQGNKKLEYGILIDNTGSMRSQFGVVNILAKALVHQVHDHGPVSIFSFDSEGVGRGSRAVPAARIEHTQDEDLLNRTIDGLYVQGGQTTLLDAIEFMDERLRAQVGASDRIIILITDGEDRVSTEKQKDLVSKLKDHKASVYAIGLVRELEDGKRAKPIKLLTSLTKETGGRVVFPKGDRIEIQNLLTELSLP